MRTLNDGVNTWLNIKDRPEGMNQRGKRYFLEYKQIRKEMGRNLVIIYFLVYKVDTPAYIKQNLWGMFKSLQNQKLYISAVMKALKEYQVEEKYERDFDRDQAQLRNRVDHVFRIIRENLRLTELYPYFRDVGFDRLTDFSVKYAEGENEAADQLKAEMEEWNTGHQDEIRKHMEETEEERQNMFRHRQKVKDDVKAEKAARRMAKRAANDEVKEIRENNRKYLARKKRVERSFERYHKR